VGAVIRPLVELLWDPWPAKKEQGVPRRTPSRFGGLGRGCAAGAELRPSHAARPKRGQTSPGWSWNRPFPKPHVFPRFMLGFPVAPTPKHSFR